MDLVRDGVAAVTVILPQDANRLQQSAVADFVATIERSTGTRLPVQSDDKPVTGPRLLIGPSAATQSLGIDEDLQPEEFLLRTVGDDLLVLAVDILHEGRARNIWGNGPSEDSAVTQWALGYLLDRFVGVRWLWPGDLGTHVPAHTNITLPALDVRFRQPLVRRSFNVIDSNAQNLRWLGYHHFAGRRRDYYFNHSFREGQDNGDWWSDFLETRPELLAKSPDGKPKWHFKDGFYKLCISNSDVADELLRRWRADGMPDFRDITPNDGNAFCTCDNCRALDRQYGDVDYTPEEIWKRPDHVGLTDRYVWFWNRIITRMRRDNPNAQVGVYLYSAYRNPPRKLKVEPGVIGEMVHGFDFSHWRAWQDAGVEQIGLRPNWLYMGASGPHLPLANVGGYIEQAREHGMTMISMDCFHEYWATQGPLYYLIARLVARPDLDREAIVAEYCQAFGAAAPAIADYLRYWETYHEERVIYNIPAGGSVRVDPDGLYARRSVEQFGQILHPLRGHWKMLPYVYDGIVMAGARDLLERAEALAADDITVHRIDFLRDGLRMVELASAYMLAHQAEDGSAMTTAADRLVDFGEAMARKHGYWHSKDVFFLKYWGLIGQEYDISPGQ